MRKNAAALNVFDHHKSEWPRSFRVKWLLEFTRFYQRTAALSAKQARDYIEEAAQLPADDLGKEWLRRKASDLQKQSADYHRDAAAIAERYKEEAAAIA